LQYILTPRYHSVCWFPDEIRDLVDQLGEKEHTIRDLTAQVRRLENEKGEMQAAIEEADASLEQSEAKLLKAISEQGDARSEADRRLIDKESEFDMTRFVYLVLYLFLLP